jgi:outer membrane receptor protein involved in Fe transport
MRVLLLASALTLAEAGWGQVSSGSISGEVRDESAGVMRGVVVIARQESTGFERRVTTGGLGSYRFEELAPGTYRIEGEKTGFRKLTVSSVTVEINQQVRLDLEMKAGAPGDSVTVKARVTPLQKEESSVGYLLDAGTLTELPLNQRNVISLVTLGPGAIPRQLGGFTHDLDNDVQAGSRGSVALNPPINGARSSMNAELLDGAYNTDRNTFAIAITPPLESVEEFRIQSSLAPAAFAQAGGGVVDVATKSGSQTFHGSGFEFFQNEATDAQSYFANPTLPTPIFRRNQFGGSLGGPVPLPSTFFFVTYEGLRGKNANPSQQLVPDATVRGGNFLGKSVIYDPLSGAVRTPFPSDAIPSARIDPIAAKYLSQYEPLPNIPATSNGDYIDNSPSTNRNDSVSGRIDHQFHKAGLLFGRYTINNEDGGIGGQFPLRPTAEDVRAQQVVLGHTFSGSDWLNEARLSFTRLRVFDVPQSAFKSNVAAALGLNDGPSDPFSFGLPYFFVTDYSTVTDDPTLPQVQRDNTWNFSDSISIARGRHNWRFGFDWIHFGFNYLQSQTVRGRYTYTGAYTGNGTDPSTGDGFADFLLGYPQQTNRTVGSAQAYLKQNNLAGYIQDDWRVTGRLTLNLGLRYDFISPFTSSGEPLLNLDYSPSPHLVQVSSSAQNDYTNFAPRIGLAYRLPGFISRRGETVFRAGFGIYYSPEIAAEAYDLVLNGIQTEMNQTTGIGLPILTTKNGFPQTSSTGFPSYFGLDPKAATPYVAQWNAGFQKELPGAIVFEAAYLGSKGTHLGRFDRENIPPSPGPGDLQARRPFPDFGTLFERSHIANSSYNSLQLKAEKRLRGSLSFLGSFVWSKSIDDADNILAGLYDSAGAQNENNLRLERGLSFANVGRRLSAGFVYGLPAAPVLRAVLNGWQLSGVITLQDGTPLNPFYIATDYANTGTPNRPNVVLGQDVSLPASQRSPQHWFNTNAFSNPAPYTYGNAGRDTIPGPGNEVIDLSLHRRIRIAERAGLELRVESFNTLNHPNWGIPGPYPDLGPFFGAIFSAGDPRRLQFGARLDF